MSFHARHLFLWLVLAFSIAGPLPCALGDEKPVPGTQQAQSFEKEILISVKLNYLLYLPKDYGSEKKSWPLLVFLHGSGESGTDLNKVKLHGPPKLIAEGKDFPFIVVSPQSSGRGWFAPALNSLVDDITSNYQVDSNRIYVTGLSMGGYGTWSLAAAYPGKFAAIAPICGGGNTDDAPKLKELPIWVFHGAKDDAVPLKRSEDMVRALKDAGSKTVELKIYPDAEHDSWTETYNNPDLYAWFLKHSRKK